MNKQHASSKIFLTLLLLTITIIANTGTAFAATVNNDTTPVSRSSVVATLWQAEQQPAADASSFGDINADPNRQAINWAAAKGIVTGYDSKTFSPNNSVSREQIAVILYRYAKLKGIDVSIGEETNILSYDDFTQISEYAFPGLQWACGAQIINGKSDYVLAPQAAITQAEFKIIMQRFNALKTK